MVGYFTYCYSHLWSSLRYFMLNLSSNGYILIKVEFLFYNTKIIIKNQSIYARLFMNDQQWQHEVIIYFMLDLKKLSDSDLIMSKMI